MKYEIIFNGEKKQGNKDLKKILDEINQKIIEEEQHGSKEKRQ